MRYADLVEMVDESVAGSAGIYAAGIYAANIPAAAAPAPPPGGSLLMLVGLPGAGKSLLIHHLQALLPVTVVSSDQVRIRALAQPGYSLEEVDAIYDLCHAVIGRRLAQGQRVVFDATNLLRRRRQALRRTAAQSGAIVAVCHVTASAADTRQRLQARHSQTRRPGDLSDAGWSVYELLQNQFEPLQLPHLVLDTSVAPPDQLAHQLRDYWLAQETI